MHDVHCIVTCKILIMVSCFTLQKNTLFKLSWKSVKWRDQPSAYWTNALTSALWVSSHLQLCKHDISPTFLNAGNSHY